MTVYNPFDDPEIAGKYEHWYHTSGKQAAHLEKQLLGSFWKNFQAQLQSWILVVERAILQIGIRKWVIKLMGWIDLS